MYMGFMIICAKTGNTAEKTQLQNSLTNSMTSNDSAIAECMRSSGATNNLLGKFKNGNYTDVEDQDPRPHQLYGQYYFSSATQASRFPKSGPGLLDERTPLFITNRSCEVPAYHLANNYHTQAKPDLPFASEPNLLDSISIDLGIAIKNSSCLVKNVDDTKHEMDFGQDENSWLSSKWLLLPMFPVTLSMKVLAPLKFKNTCSTIWTFVVSIALIGGLTYVSVWMVHCFGQTVGIPETVAGMTILSWGTGIPELIASIVLIKKTAQADMAICNTIGSNVIDASFCLSLPWIIKCIMNMSAGNEASVEIHSAALPWTSFTLFLSVVLLILILKVHDWKLNCSVGICLTITYVAFVVVATYLESSFSESGLNLLADV